MVNRPAGGARSKRRERAEFDWYIEPRFVVEQLFDAIDFEPGLVWDGCCGRGTTLDVAKERGHWTVGSDVVDRNPRHKFYRGNIMSSTKWPNSGERPLYYVSNPPYGYETDIAEKIIRKVLTTVPYRRAAFLLPIAFVASAGRWSLFMREFRPSHVLICSQRPTMPPGHMIDEMGDAAFKGGMADYVWIVWSAGGPYRTEALWLRPTE